LAFLDALSQAANGEDDPAKFQATLPLTSPSAASPSVALPAPGTATSFAAPKVDIMSAEVPPAVRAALAEAPSRRGWILGSAGALAVILGGGGIWAWTHREPPADLDPKNFDPRQGGGEGGIVTPPELVREVKAQYTAEARRLGIEGTVRLRIGINEHGRVEEAEVLKSLDPGLDRKALEAVRLWIFKPAMRNGKAVAVRSQVEQKFVIPKER
jgi:TonB family protein